jgi:hypothetical protein
LTPVITRIDPHTVGTEAECRLSPPSRRANWRLHSDAFAPALAPASPAGRSLPPPRAETPHAMRPSLSPPRKASAAADQTLASAGSSEPPATVWFSLVPLAMPKMRLRPLCRGFSLCSMPPATVVVAEDAPAPAPFTHRFFGSSSLASVTQHSRWISTRPPQPSPVARPCSDREPDGRQQSSLFGASADRQPS